MKKYDKAKLIASILTIIMCCIAIISIVIYMDNEAKKSEYRDSIEERISYALEAIVEIQSSSHVIEPVETETTIPIINVIIVGNENIAEELNSSSTIDKEENTAYVMNDLAHREFIVASKVFDALYEKTGSTVVASAIVGNCMVECGYSTMYLNPYATNTLGCYGICQWMVNYFPEVYGMNLEDQIQYLVDSLESTFDKYYWRYSSSMSYEEFINMTDVEEASYVFAKVYENCGNSYEQRKTCARCAYEFYKGAD